jgi:hypothetical protein
MKNENVMRNVPQKLISNNFVLFFNEYILKKSRAFIEEPATKLPAKEKHLAKKPALSGLAPKLASKISIKTDSLKRPVSNKKVNEGKQSVTKESCSSNSIDYDKVIHYIIIVTNHFILLHKKPKLPEEQLLQAEEAMRICWPIIIIMFIFYFSIIITFIIVDSTIPASIKTGLNSKLWKERYEASKELLKFLENSVQSKKSLFAKTRSLFSMALYIYYYNYFFFITILLLAFNMLFLLFLISFAAFFCF